MSHGKFLTRGCSGKRPMTEPEARAAAERRNRDVARREPRWRAYACACGPHWHIGRRHHGGHGLRSA